MIALKDRVFVENLKITISNHRLLASNHSQFELAISKC